LDFARAVEPFLIRCTAVALRPQDNDVTSAQTAFDSESISIRADSDIVGQAESAFCLSNVEEYAEKNGKIGFKKFPKSPNYIDVHRSKISASAKGAGNRQVAANFRISPGLTNAANRSH
jgi:hypothetical protein